MSEEAVITAHVQSEQLIRMATNAVAHWEEKLAEAEAAYEANLESIIQGVIDTKKTFWTRRTRTRDEAIAYLGRTSSIFGWQYGLDSGSTVRRAQRTLNRAKEILELASETNFKNITLPEDDLRLVGGLSD